MVPADDIPKQDWAIPIPHADIRLRIFVELSAAHLTEALANALEQQCDRRGRGGGTEGMPTVWNLETGFLLWVPDPEFAHPDFGRGIDPVLQQILAVARQAGADYLLLDRDADTCAGLPVFDW